MRRFGMYFHYKLTNYFTIIELPTSSCEEHQFITFQLI